jgi:hypothetical protein
MNEGKAFVAALLLLIAATAVARRYLTRDAQIALGVIAAVAHLA